MRCAHVSYGLACGAKLITVRGNLRHTPISMMLAYQHSDEVQRARKFDQAFGSRDFTRQVLVDGIRGMSVSLHNFNAYDRELSF